MRSSRDFRSCQPGRYDAVAGTTSRRYENFFPLRSPLHYRSDAFARGALVVLPSFDSLGQGAMGRQAVILAVLAGVAIVALLVAGAAYLNDHRRRPAGGVDDEELFTSTPLPVPREELARMARESPHHAFRSLSIPRWVQAGSLLAALAMTWAVAERVRPNNGLDRGRFESVRGDGVGPARDVAEDSPEDLDLSPDSSPAFAFQARNWVDRPGGGCAGRLEVTKGEPNAWSLTARVHDGRGQLIDTARARVASLREGEVVEFSFPRADCDRIGAWDVRGARRSP